MYDYVAGKLDWMAAGLPTEGTASARPRAADVARRDAPTCGLTEKLGAVRRRVRDLGWDAVVVVNDERIVLGFLRARELGGDPDASIDAAMRPGPSTFRPFVAIDDMARLMAEHDLESSPVTTSDGRLVGVLLRADVVAAAGGA